MAARLILWVVCAGVLAACIPSIPTPPSGSHAGEVPITVPYPPPPARVDVIADPPADMASPAWIDGQWLWLGRRWVWEPGRWVGLAAGTVYAGPRVYRRTDGQLVWFKGVLKSSGGGASVAPSPPAVAEKPKETAQP